jgi:hypothetical protein
MDSLTNLLKKGDGVLSTKTVNMWSGDGSSRHRLGSRSATGIFSNISEIKDYTDIIIDISAIPRSIYFSLIGKMLYLIDQVKNGISIPNLHVVVSENAKLDQIIRSIDIDDTAGYIHGFSSDIETEATTGIPTIWIPILGEDKSGQLERIYNHVNPDEICPVLPFPSLNPRRGDELLIAYREFLFDKWRIESRNIIYASEQNPFETYRQIYKAVYHYNQALKPLGGCKVAVSAVSSKLLSIGALLAVYEMKENFSIGLAHIGTQGYNMDEVLTTTGNRNSELFSLWLAGECYES